jgi:hypothetical protein
LNGRAVNDEVLLTILKEVASLLNTRPITHVSTDPFEPEPLTPNHFILGCHHPHLPPNVEDAFPCASRKHWEQAQFIVNQFWRRWMREYVPELIERKKWNKKTREMRLGDRVLVLWVVVVYGSWPVTKLFHGDGGVVRKVLVKTPKSEFVRPIVKLCLISDA